MPWPWEPSPECITAATDNASRLQFADSPRRRMDMQSAPPVPVLPESLLVLEGHLPGARES